MKYLFKRAADGVTICGETDKSVYPFPLWIDPQAGNIVHFRQANAERFELDVDITTVKKENGEFYADIDEFNGVSGTFFFKLNSSGTGGSGSAFGTVQITGDGENMDYNMPANCDITGPFAINSDMYDAILLIVGVQKTIRFSQVLTAEQLPTVLYTKTGVPVTNTGNIDLTDNHTLALTDAEKTLFVNSADAKVITIPLNADVAIPVNTRIELVREGAGTLIVSVAVGVTLNSAGGNLGLRAQYSAASLVKRSADVWYLIGDLTT